MIGITSGGQQHTAIPKRDVEGKTQANGPVVTYKLSPEELEKYRAVGKPADTNGKVLKQPMVHNNKAQQEAIMQEKVPVQKDFLEQIAAGKSISAIERAWAMKGGALHYWVRKWGLTGINPGRARQLLDEMLIDGGVPVCDPKQEERAQEDTPVPWTPTAADYESVKHALQEQMERAEEAEAQASRLMADIAGLLDRLAAQSAEPAPVAAAAAPELEVKDGALRIPLAAIQQLIQPAVTFSFDDYQELAQRTADQSKERQLRAAIAGLGITGEAGEAADLLKKHIGHGHELDREELLKELGDVLWYLAEISSIFGFRLEEVAQANICKLRARYPDGFSREASIHRQEA